MAPPFLTWALDGGERSASRTSRFIPGEIAPGTHWMGDWVRPKAHLDVWRREILPLPGSNPGRPTSSPSLYRLSHPDS
jgi:hypothetical protein